MILLLRCFEKLIPDRFNSTNAAYNVAWEIILGTQPIILQLQQQRVE